MNAGKTTLMIQARHNYLEMGMKALVFVPSIAISDSGEAVSRTGLSVPADSIGDEDGISRDFSGVDVIFVDEAQFLTRDQVDNLACIVDRDDIPVIAYGLRTDFMGNLFEGSSRLLALADVISEVKTVCHCGKKATMTLRVCDDGTSVKDGTQIMIGGNESYRSVCRRHYMEEMW